MPEAIGTVGGAVLPYPAGRAWEAHLARGTAHKFTVTDKEFEDIRLEHAAYDFGARRMRILLESEWRENEQPPSEPDEEEIRREAFDRFMQENDLTEEKVRDMLKRIA